MKGLDGIDGKGAEISNSPILVICLFGFKFALSHFQT